MARAVRRVKQSQRITPIPAAPGHHNKPSPKILLSPGFHPKPTIDPAYHRTSCPPHLASWPGLDSSGITALFRNILLLSLAEIVRTAVAAPDRYTSAEFVYDIFLAPFSFCFLLAHSVRYFAPRPALFLKLNSLLLYYSHTFRPLCALCFERQSRLPDFPRLRPPFAFDHLCGPQRCQPIRDATTHGVKESRLRGSPREPLRPLLQNGCWEQTAIHRTPAARPDRDRVDQHWPHRLGLRCLQAHRR